MRVGPKEVFKDYLMNSSFHGLRFIADNERHWTERLFWLVCVMLCWYASGLLTIASWDAFQNNAISFVMETTYKDWNTKFPAVCVCENDNLNRVFDASDMFWTPNHEVELDEVLRELAYFKGLTFYTLQYCDKEDADPLCPKSNYSYLASVVRSKCDQSLMNCRYNNKLFDCCDNFEPIDTDMGRCYIVNSVQSKKNNKPKLKMTVNRKNKLGLLSFELIIPATVYILGEEEVPTITTLQSDFFTATENNKYRRHIAIRNIANDPVARETTSAQRKCRYQDENTLDVYPYFSYSACTVQCRKDHQKKFCNCTDHFMPNSKEEEVCGLRGLVCLNQYHSDLSVMRPPWSRRNGLVCDCLPSCTEADITVIKDDKGFREKTASLVEIEMDYLPTERFQRNVVRSRLDLVGGTAGLLVGASLLSFVELIYYLTIRYYGTVYMLKKRKNTQNNQSSFPKIHYVSEKTRPFVEIKRTRSALHKLKF